MGFKIRKATAKDYECINKLACEVHELHVTARPNNFRECKGKGVGKLLFKKALEYTKEIGASNLELSVWEFNNDASKFYEAMGMRTKTRKMEIEV